MQWLGLWWEVWWVQIDTSNRLVHSWWEFAWKQPTADGHPPAPWHQQHHLQREVCERTGTESCLRKPTTSMRLLNWCFRSSSRTSEDGRDVTIKFTSRRAWPWTIERTYALQFCNLTSSKPSSTIQTRFRFLSDVCTDLSLITGRHGYQSETNEGAVIRLLGIADAALSHGQGKNKLHVCPDFAQRPL